MVTVSSFDPLRQEHFEGYCFAGADYVAGDDGFQAFRRAGGAVVPGLDGCYIVVQRASTAWTLGTDARGLRRLFVYRNGVDWAVASSLHELVSHLRSHGVRPEVRLALLRAFGVRKALTANLNSLQTIFRDIELVPSFCSVQIGDAGPEIVQRPRPAGTPTYEESLREHIGAWRSRLATLMADPRTTFTMDLSGGLDSRVVFAFALAGGLFDGDPARFQLVSQQRMAEDFAAATLIARRHRVPLNGPELAPRTANSVENALASWRGHSLGLYMPVYLNPYEFDPLSVRGHGAGGGTFRELFSETTTLRSRLESTRGGFPQGAFDEYADTVIADLDRLSAMRPEVDPHKLHYREFRNRFHFGHAPHLRMLYSPLNSILIDRIADRPGSNDRRTYYDLMDALAPGLKNEPYDDPAKAPATPDPSAIAESLRNLRIDAGRVFAAPRHLDTSVANCQRAAFDAFYRQAASAARNSAVRDAIGDTRVIKRAQAFLEAVRARTGRPRANDPGHQDAAYLLTAAFATGG